MLIKLIEVKKKASTDSVYLDEIYVNPAHIISVVFDRGGEESLINEVKSLGLVENTSLSIMVVSEGNNTRTLTVVGSPMQIHEKIYTRKILRG